MVFVTVVTDRFSAMYDSYVWDLNVPNVPAPCAPSATSSVENNQSGLLERELLKPRSVFVITRRNFC